MNIRSTVAVATLGIVLVLGLFAAAPAAATPFTASCTDCPLAIPPSGSSGTTSSFLNVGPNVAISDLDVFLDLDHTFTGDLDIFLFAPDSTGVQLFDQDGGLGNNITNVLFNDQASTAIDVFAPPYTECATAVGCQVDSTNDGSALSDFNGLMSAGSWELRIIDRLGGDVGLLKDWELRFNGAAVPAPMPLALLGLGLLALAARRRARRS